MLLAAVIALVVVAGGLTIYLTGDSRAVQSTTASSGALPTGATGAPTSLRLLWQQSSDPASGSAASAYGIVVTSDGHAVVGRDPATGAERWRYSRPNRELCEVFSSDVTDQGQLRDSGQGVRGIVAVYRHGGYCAEVVSLDPRTGERVYQRTTAGALDGRLVAGGPYTGWLGPDLLELWRWDMVRTYQYGNQPASKESNTAHTGCVFLDVAVTDQQFATVERCAAQGGNARLAVNWSDPNSHDDKFSDYRSEPRGDVDTGSPDARIVGITRDRVAVLVSSPVVAVVVYEADGTVVSRTPVGLPASVVSDAGGPTPRIELDDMQYSLLGDHLVAVRTADRTVQVTETPTAAGDTGDQADTSDLLPTSGSAAPSASVTQETRESPEYAWQLDGALGLPAAWSGLALVPTDAGVQVVDRTTGRASRTIAVDRPSGTGRVDLWTVGTDVVELRRAATPDGGTPASASVAVYAGGR